MWNTYKLIRNCKNIYSSRWKTSYVNYIPNKIDNIKWNIKFPSVAKSNQRNWGSIVFKFTLGVSSACGVKALQFKKVICEAEHDRTRLVGLETEEDEPEFKWSEFWLLLKPHLWELLSAILAALACAYLNVRIPIELGKIINVVQESYRNGSKMFLDNIKTPGFVLLGMYVLQSVFTFLYITALSDVGESLAHQMKTKLFASIITQEIAFFDKQRTGELLNRLTVDVHDFKSAFKMVVSQGLRNIAQLVGSTISLFLISPQMTGVMVLIVPSIIAVGTVIGSLLRSTSLKAKAQAAKVTLIAEEALSNIRTIRAFAMEDIEEDVFNVESDKARKLNEKLGLGIGLFQAGTNLFLNTMVLGTIYMGGYMLSTERMTAGDIMAFLVAVQVVQRSFAQISLLFGTYVKGIHAGARVFQFMEDDPNKRLQEGYAVPYHSFVADIEFKDVSFAYPGREQHAVLKDFSLKIPAGKTVAIVGSSGSGKSTIAWLLERFYDVDKGEIKIADVDICHLKQSWLRGRVIGFISQEPVLFATSVLENIRYGRPGATDTEVVQAAKLANAHDFIVDFPDGYNTMVGERGVSVSGGQKQRIAIARALLKNPSILVLDEATSALDAESEQVVQSALENVMKNRTTIIIAHRLSTIRNADCIVVLDHGKIVESGTHAQLMSQNGVYSHLVKQQSNDNDNSSIKTLFKFLQS